MSQIHYEKDIVQIFFGTGICVGMSSQTRSLRSGRLFPFQTNTTIMEISISLVPAPGASSSADSPPFNRLLFKCSSRRNTLSLAASLRFLPTEGSKFTQFRKLGRLYPASDSAKEPFGPFILTQVGPKTCSKARLAKSSSCSLSRSYRWILFGQQTVNLRTRSSRLGQRNA
ncbi:MAG: hypothetical protein A4E65_03396 [Syntrophorhabdus sp. PtaU1.Bin153]|nr:MAG: hypothetical protein A4E65_03396 [Syntrophorhabdus sp. PtaU1.Bin153]